MLIHWTLILGQINEFTWVIIQGNLVSGCPVSQLMLCRADGLLRLVLVPGLWSGSSLDQLLALAFGSASSKYLLQVFWRDMGLNREGVHWLD